MRDGVGQFQKQAQAQVQRQSQKQVQRMSQRQIQAVSFLAMGSRELREEIFKMAGTNPALEIVSDPLASSSEDLKRFQEKQNSINSESQSLSADYATDYSSHRNQEYSLSEKTDSYKSDQFQSALENQEATGETLQQHLMDQLNLTKVSEDEFSICRSLIYNLDKDGCYGSMLAPESLLDKTRPLQTKELLSKCIDKIHRMDPVGTCCKNLEESLYVQAKLDPEAPELALFILDGRLELLNPPIPDKVLKNLKNYREKWHSKVFAHRLFIDDIELNLDSLDLIEETIDFIRSLNPRPAGDYISDTSERIFYQPDIILSVEKVKGKLYVDDFLHGKVTGGDDFYYQVKYASGALPELTVSNDYFDKAAVEKANEFISNLKFRESTSVLQGSAIVHFQQDFFEKGPGHLGFLTRRQVAQMLQIHESTVSRMSSKNNSKFIQTEWGLFPASYFFSSGVSSSDGKNKISSEVIKEKIKEFLQEANYSDSQLTALLNDQGIKIARRTVTKYRQQDGIQNSYTR